MFATLKLEPRYYNDGTPDSELSIEARIQKARCISQVRQTTPGAQPEFETSASKFHEVFDVDDVTLTSQIMTSYRKIDIASKNILNYSYFKFASQLEKDWNFGYVVFYFLRQERVHVNLSFYKKMCIIISSQIFRFLKPKPV